MNKVILMGRLARDPEMQTTPNGVTLCRFAIAVNRRFAKEGQQQADFINCTAWRQTAEFICKFFKKGSMIAVTGSLQTRSWEQDGKTRYATDVVVEEAYFTGSKAESGSTAPANAGSFVEHHAEEGDPFSEDPGAMGFAAMGNSEDDLPF